MKNELLVLRICIIILAVGMVFILIFVLINNRNQKFNIINAERINIIESDGTIRMVITGSDQFPTGHDIINNRPTNASRQGMAGLLFFNDDGMEQGGLIYFGENGENGHRQGFHFAMDQYDGDQVLTLTMQDMILNEERVGVRGIVFYDRSDTESLYTLLEEQHEWAELTPEELAIRLQNYRDQGLAGEALRMFIGRSFEQFNGIFLYDSNQRPRIFMYIDRDDNPNLIFFDENGEIKISLP